MKSANVTDLEFDNVNKQVSLRTQSGSNIGAVFAYRQNMKSIQRVVDTRSLVTRLYAYGADAVSYTHLWRVDTEQALDTANDIPNKTGNLVFYPRNHGRNTTPKSCHDILSDIGKHPGICRKRRNRRRFL